ncbi:MAG: hypothetical protein Q9195_001836 [Heterodermia aff. obscurata]
MTASETLMTPQMRSMRLIGNNNPGYQWEKYYKTEEELKLMKKPVRRYYERNNHLICSYLYIDRLLDSSLPHSLIQEYNQPVEPWVNVQDSLEGGLVKPTDDLDCSADLLDQPQKNGYSTHVKVKRTPRNIYKVPNEDSPLLGDVNGPKPLDLAEEEDAESGSPIVSVAIYLNLAANATLLVGKIVSHFLILFLIFSVVIVLTSSLSVLASLILLYLTMRFASTIRKIQGLQAYHAGDKLNVEVDIVLDEKMSLRDSHDLGESLQYVLESVPSVDRAFVHLDYSDWNLSNHMQQQAE